MSNHVPLVEDGLPHILVYLVQLCDASGPSQMPVTTKDNITPLGNPNP